MNKWQSGVSSQWMYVKQRNQGTFRVILAAIPHMHVVWFALIYFLIVFISFVFKNPMLG